MNRHKDKTNINLSNLPKLAKIKQIIKNILRSWVLLKSNTRYRNYCDYQAILQINGIKFPTIMTQAYLLPLKYSNL